MVPEAAVRAMNAGAGPTKQDLVRRPGNPACPRTRSLMKMARQVGKMVAFRWANVKLNYAARVQSVIEGDHGDGGNTHVLKQIQTETTGSEARRLTSPGRRPRL